MDNIVDKSHNVLTIKELDYMLSIVHSSLDEEEKAIKLYSVCDEERLLNTKNLYERLLLHETSSVIELMKLYSKYRSKGYFKNASYALGISCMQENLPYARFVINSYIESNSSYNESEFYDYLGINKDIFDYCVATVEELDVNLYNSYLAKRKVNDTTTTKININIITYLAELIHSNSCDVLEFTKRIPFKEQENFQVILNEFIKKYIPEKFSTINQYMRVNGLASANAFKPLDIVALYEIEDDTITNYDKDYIIDYLIYSGIPLIDKTYNIAKDKYINGEITREMVIELKNNWQPKEPAKTLIPSK